MNTPRRELLRRPGVLPALVAGLASFSVMVSVMNLSGYVIVDHHQHHPSDVFPVIGAHVLGMYALVLVVGNLIDRLGRVPALIGGLAIMSASCLGLLVAESVWATAVCLFGLGLGWNFSYVAASAVLVDRTAPRERGKLLGFSDQLGAFTGAALALIGRRAERDRRGGPGGRLCRAGDRPGAVDPPAWGARSAACPGLTVLLRCRARARGVLPDNEPQACPTRFRRRAGWSSRTAFSASISVWCARSHPTWRPGIRRRTPRG